ncbi:hypothetical protein [Clostridium estertheticum]|nr:hypothetical protein [Clostridium estertheticum]MBU3074767.1 hypothetical protein [Clostridium estertheticum]MBU3164982.1 hypothetical protein [Clostridium estertheticum]MBU3173916.1 hypothetical protein [Clostridium estertheticum]MBU3186773.1 hypothetical protein [Clostridium estertheticum]MBZ9615094.1 hypothetical protein [Clostridium estertheticum subsp. laramiense]
MLAGEIRETTPWSGSEQGCGNAQKMFVDDIDSLELLLAHGWQVIVF